MSSVAVISSVDFEGITLNLTNPINEKGPMDLVVAERLLHLLGTDNSFRRLFRKDPLAALLEAGYKFAVSSKDNAHRGAQFLPTLSCLAVSKLASKKEIQRSSKKIISFLTSNTNHTVVFALESGKTHNILKS